jgi:putative sodium/glutamine symporter
MWLWVYRIGVIAMVLFGAIAKVQLVWDLADLFMGLMVVVNLIAILMLSKVTFEALKDYKRQKAEGLDPVFTRDLIRIPGEVECWESEAGVTGTKEMKIAK